MPESSFRKFDMPKMIRWIVLIVAILALWASPALGQRALAPKASDPQLKAGYDWILAGEKAKKNPPRVDAKALQTYAGEYGERKVTFENGTLFYQRTGPKYRLAPMTPTLFALDGLDNFRIEFVVKDGKAVELIGFYDNGERQPSSRTK